MQVASVLRRPTMLYTDEPDFQADSVAVGASRRPPPPICRLRRPRPRRCGCSAFVCTLLKLPPCSLLAQVLRRDIPWDIYQTARLITDRDLQLLRRFDKKEASYQAKLLEEVGAGGSARVPR